MVVLLAGAVLFGCKGKKRKTPVADTGGPISAAFVGSPTSGDAPLIVTFTDQSTADSGIDTWSWDFGDGGTSTQQSPQHTYSDAGAYTVSLTVGGADGSDTETKTNYITVNTGSGDLPAYVVQFDDIAIAVEDDATLSRLEELAGRLLSWVEYLWEFTGGQMCVHKISIHDRTRPSTTGQFLIHIPSGKLDSSMVSGFAYGWYDRYDDLIGVGGLFPFITLLHEFAHARMQHELFEEYSYSGNCQCIMGPTYLGLWCDDYNHTNSCPWSCWQSFVWKYSDWVPPHEASGNVPAAWTERSSRARPKMVFDLYDN
jgi:PKD repeat protein